MKKILIIRFSSIGDIVLTTPVIRCVKKQLDCELHFCTKESFKTILANNPYVDKIHLLKDNIPALIKELQKENFDYVIDLHHNLRTLRVKRALKAPSVSFNKINIPKWLMVQFKINRLPAVHIVDRYMQAVSSLGVENDNEGLDYFIPEKDKVFLSSSGDFKSGNYVAIAMGAQHATKRLPLHKLIELCRNIPSPIILLGGKEDSSTAEQILEALPERRDIFQGCGQFNLNQSASLLEQAKLVVAHDTGLMHMAAAFKKEIWSIWGNTIPGFGMYPYQTHHHVVEVKGLSCRPCSKIGYKSCPKKHFKCMEQQDLSFAKSL
ncbi:MAG TPA: glycosyltransferase family 9 protein [Cytophagaceae bacterium]|nr:glycosyltransferase family 9 protein [Cytophagaceae bacterium]